MEIGIYRENSIVKDKRKYCWRRKKKMGGRGKSTIDGGLR